MGTRNLEVSRFEVTGVFTHPDAKVDIVLVHGLNGQPGHTWTGKNGLFWPAELLPETLEERPANVLVYGYNADVYSRKNSGSASNDFIYQHAQTLVAHLTAYRQREHTTNNAIIWIAHSLGGILVKRALLYSNDLRDAEHDTHRSIYVSTYGIIFLGTPHTGSGLATWGHVLQAMSDAVLPRKIFESESILLKTLKRDNERLQEINNHFLDIYQRFRIQMVHENHKTDLKGTKALVVDADSASPQLPGVTYYGIEATHSGMCKFDGPTAPGYRTMTTAVYEWVGDAPQVIEVRWTVEREDRLARLRREMEERRLPFDPLTPAGDTSPGADAHVQGQLLHAPNKDQAAVAQDAGRHPVSDAATSPMPFPPSPGPPAEPSTPTARPDPLFLHPEKFRPNSYFFGRKKEMAELHAMLTDPTRRAEGTSAVVIHSLPGGGKTHLARQYVFQHRNDYPGGIYWVRAKSIPEMEQFYWKIAKNEALRDVVASTLAGGTKTPGIADDSQKDLCDPHRIVDIVRGWFASFDQWLLVFDGILFSKPGIEHFIPDAKNTSLIFTSIQSSVGGRYEFDNPRTLKLEMMSPPDARDLLLTEMERKLPWTADDRSRALDLVKHLGCLPLMIHIAAQHLKTTREPMSKYMRTYRTRTRAGDLSAYIAVLDELKSRGFAPALNLMYILAYFDSRIPVGLLHLGLRALDSRTPVLTRDASHRHRSLNNSLRILIAFALLERDEANTISPTSSQNSSRRSYDNAPGSVDLLRIHTVVQQFFVDVLADDKQSDFWLERAACVFCSAFDEATEMIKNTPKVGLLDDYRCFKVHGEKLLEYFQRLDKRNAVPADLVSARNNIRSRLGICEQAIVELSEAVQTYIVTEMDIENPSAEDYSLVSVFESASTISDSDDSANSSSQNSGNNSASSTRIGTGLDGDRVAVHIVGTSPGMHMGIDSPAGGGQVEDPIVGKGKAPMTSLDTQVPIGGTGKIYQSPESNLSSVFPGGHNPYHWHVPYPPNQDTIPAPPTPGEMDETDDGMTEVLTPHALVMSPVETEAETIYRNDSFLAGFGLRSNPSSHRTVRRINERRYSDRAGAWRDKTISDPRISVSRELAEGSVYMPHYEASSTRSPGKNRLTAESEAELALNKLRAAGGLYSSQRSQRGSVAASDISVSADGDIGQRRQSKSRAQSTGSVGVRPLQILRQNIPELGRFGQETIDEDLAMASSHESISLHPHKRPSQSPPPSWKLTLKRLRDSVLPSRPGSSGSQTQAGHPSKRPENIRPSTGGQTHPPRDGEDALSHSIGSLPRANPHSMFIGSRSANSSPNQGHGPFAPPRHLPPSHHHFTPDPHILDGGNSADGGGGHGTSIRQWAAQTYHSGHERLSSTDLSYSFHDQDPMAASYPFAGPSSYPQPFSLQAPQLPTMPLSHGGPSALQRQQLFLRPARLADGYTSQPLSRDTSSQSHALPGDDSRDLSSSQVLPPRVGELGGSVDENPPHSHSQPQSVDGDAMPIALQPSVMHRPSQSSLVETEPSLPTANYFPDVTTSYQRWEERHTGPYSTSYRVTEMQSSFRPTLGTISAGAVHHSVSGSASGSGSNSGAAVARPGGVAMSRSQSDSVAGSMPDSGSRRGSEAVPAAGAWVARGTAAVPMGPSAAVGNGNTPYPTQVVHADGNGSASDPISRVESGNGGGNGSARENGHAGHVLEELGNSKH